MKHKRRMTLKREVFLLCLTYSLIFTAVFTLIFGSVLFAGKLNGMKQQLQSSNAEIKIYLDTLFEDSVHMLDYLDAMLTLTSRDTGEQEKILESFQNIQNSTADLLHIFVGYNDGTLLVNDYPLDENYDARNRPWYRKAVEVYPETAVALLYQEYTTGDWCFCTAKALADKTGMITAVVAVDFLVDKLFEDAIQKSYYDTQVNYLMDENGVCTYHPNRDLIGLNVMEKMKDPSQMILISQGYIEYTANQENKIAYYDHLDQSDSILVSSIYRKDVIAPAIAELLHVLLALVLLSVLMSMLFMLVFDYRYVTPVKALKVRLASLLAGETVIKTKLSYPNDEFSEIADSMEGLTKYTLSQKAEELNAILESSSDGILVLDRDDRVLHYNNQLLLLWGLNPKGVYETYQDLGVDERLLIPDSCGHPSTQIAETELCYLKSGTILERYTRMLNQHERIDGTLCVYRDATEKVRKEEQLKEIANTDFLTGLNNRRYFSFLAAREFHRAKENNESLALLMLDIDYFKTINDTYGHDIGDKALQAFAAHLRQCSRRSDVLGRYGGEEFCVLLPFTDLEVATRIAERVRMHFEKTAIDNKGQKISWTVSIGVAINGSGVASVETLIKHADIACYAAKQHGRNQVMTYSSEYIETSPKNE